jgi:hypothetical protein
MDQVVKVLAVVVVLVVLVPFGGSLHLVELGCVVLLQILLVFPKNSAVFGFFLTVPL